MNSIKCFLGILTNPRIFAVLLLFVLSIAFSVPANAQETQAAPVKAEKPKKIKPLKVESEDGLASVQLGFAAQLQYDSNWTNITEENGKSQDHDHKFTFKRIQTSLNGHLFSKDFTYKLQVETIPGKITLMDLFVDYQFHQQARLRLGAHKPGFSRKRMNSWKNQALVDFSNAPRYYGTERALGLTLHNGYGKKTSHEYEIGVYGGIPWRSNCTKGITMISKEKMLEPGLLSGGADAYNEFHPEIIGHYAYLFNGIDVTTETDWKRRDFRFSVGLGFSYDFRPKAFRDPAARTAFEFMMKAYGFSFFGTFFTAYHDMESGLDSDIDLAILGGVVQASYLLPIPLEFAVRYFGNTTTETFRDDARANAATIVAADPTLADSYKGAGDLKVEHELSFGINCYPFGRHVKIATDASWIMKDYVSKDAQSDMRLRLLLQFSL